MLVWRPWGDAVAAAAAVSGVSQTIDVHPGVQKSTLRTICRSGTTRHVPPQESRLGIHPEPPEKKGRRPSL
jgi:hypothetical protein